MADPQVKIVMSLVDNVSQKMKGITGVTGGLGSAFQSLTGFSLGAAGGIAAVTLGIQKGIKFAKESVTEVTAYNKTIREMGQVTGLGAEALSRIIQVGDDWGISIDSIRTALAFMNKQGVTPSIDKLAELADSYVAATDKSKWANEAVKTLGRGYQTLIPLLALGGDGFRDAAAGIDESLIATDEGIAASREYEVAMDDLQDTVTGLKYELGNGLIPALVDVLGAVNDVTSRVTSEQAAWKKLKKAHEEGLITQGELTESYLKISTGLWDAEDATNFLASAAKKLEARFEDGGHELERYNRLFDDLNEKSVITTAVFKPMTKSVSESKEAMWDAFNAANGLTGGLEKLKAAADVAFDDLVSSVNGPVDTALDDFNETQIGLKAQMRLLKDEMDLDPQADNVDELKAEYNKLDYQVKLNAINHKIAMKGMIADMVIAKLSVDGFTEAERGFITQMLTDLGLADNATYQVLMGSTDIANYILGGDMAAAGTVLQGLYNHILGIEGDHTVRFNIVVNGQIPDFGVDNTPVPVPVDSNGDPIYGDRQSSGADYVIPPGFDNDNYPLGFDKSGERVVVIPKGQSSNTTNNFNMNIHTNAQSSSLMRDFNRMKAWAN